VETEELHLSDSNEENKDAANIDSSQPPTEQIQEDSRTEDNNTKQDDQEFTDKLEIADKSDDQMEE